MRVVSYERAGRAGVGELEDRTIHPFTAATVVEWLAGAGDEPTGEMVPIDAVEMLAPVPSPPSVRDFIGFPDQLEAMAARRGAAAPEQWRQAPAFHFANPAAVEGSGTAVEIPAATKAFDFEVEVAAAIGADEQIAGFMLVCDWTARDIEHRELAVGLGPHKSKDFATSVGPWLVTPDELPYSDGQLELDITVTVNETAVSRCPTGGMQFAWPELVEAAAEGTQLLPGDLIASGALPGGSLIELGKEALDPAGEEPWLLPGDTVEISCEHLGSLVVQIS